MGFWTLVNTVNEIVEASNHNRQVSVENLSKTKFAQKKSSVKPDTEEPIKETRPTTESKLLQYWYWVR